MNAYVKSVIWRKYMVDLKSLIDRSDQFYQNINKIDFIESSVPAPLVLFTFLTPVELFFNSQEMNMVNVKSVDFIDKCITRLFRYHRNQR